MNSPAKTEASAKGRKAKYLDHPNAPLVNCRLANLEELLRSYGSKTKLASQIGISTAHMGQYFALGKYYFRPVGDAMARKIEVALGLKPYVLDKTNGTVGVASIHSQTMNPPRQSAHNHDFPQLKPLHEASLDAFRDALVAGRVSDTECIAMLSKWIKPEGMEPSAS